jgi:hypothetical protein
MFSSNQFPADIHVRETSRTTKNGKMPSFVYLRVNTRCNKTPGLSEYMKIYMLKFDPFNCEN